MGNRNDSSGEKPGVTTDHGAAGRVEVDAAGNRVWRWTSDSSDSTSILIKKLDNTSLSLEPTQKIPVVGGAKQAGTTPRPQPKRAPLSVARDDGERDSGGGFDPYNSRRR
jgi:hypothetical protein